LAVRWVGTVKPVVKDFLILDGDEVTADSDEVFAARSSVILNKRLERSATLQLLDLAVILEHCNAVSEVASALPISSAVQPGAVGFKLGHAFSNVNAQKMGD
jgi:hypothetical protein